MSLRIAVDLRPLLDVNESGVTVYIKQMLIHLQEMKNLELDLYYFSSKRCTRIHEFFHGVRHIKISNFRFHLKSLFSFPDLPNSFFAKKPDIIWIPDRRPFFRTEIPVVMTIHDLVPEKFRSSLSLKSRVWHFVFSLRRLIQNSDAFLVPTFTIHSQLDRNLIKEVTYEGADMSMQAKAVAKKYSAKPYFLSIAPADPRKRLDWIIKMAIRFPKINFVIAGVKAKDKRFARINLKSFKNLHVLPYVSDEEKKFLLKNAQALLALSKYEGFDLPVLEAVRVNCPVIMSDIPVHHELYKDAVFVSDLNDLERSIYSYKNRKAKVPTPRGDYTWEKAANRALLFFRRVVTNKN